MPSSQSPKPGSAREELFRRVAGSFVDEARADQLIGAAIAEDFRAAAEEIASAVPPLEAGPRTEFERGLMTAVHALRRRANELDGGES